MRPTSLAEMYEWILAGVPRETALPEFLDSFYLAPTDDVRMTMLADEPRLTGDSRWDALAGAIADYLSRRYLLPDVPQWAFKSCRFLDAPWHASPFDSDGMREYLSFASPAEFRSRNIFTEERPLRRARSHLPCVNRLAGSGPQ